MNILFLCRLYTPHIGGVEKHVEEITKILSQENNVTIITEKYAENLQDHESTPYANIFRIPVGNSSERNKKWFIWKWFSTHLNLINSADVIHVHDVFFWLLPFRIIFPFKKIYITFHGYEGDSEPNMRQIFMHRIAQYLSNGNICVAEYQQKWYHVKPDFVTYGGVTPSVSKNSQKVCKSIYIGRLSEDTGIMPCLKACKELGLSLDVYGDGPQSNLAHEYAEKYRLLVKFHGFVPNAAIHLSGHSISFVSRYLSILESLSQGVPVVAHYNNQIKKDSLTMSRLEKYIWVCGSVDEIVANCLQILDNLPAVSQKATQGKKFASLQTWNSVAILYKNLWQKHLPIQKPL